MDEESSLSTAQVQPQASSSSTPTEAANGASKNRSDGDGDKQPQIHLPSTSQNYKFQREFGYEETIPFAPWRRKRYALTVQGLHEEIVDMYHWIRPNEIESRLRTKVFEKVRDSVQKRWMPHKKIKISMFGSLRTNLFLPTSDIDVLVECEDWCGKSGDPKETEKWLHETAKGLEEDDIAESVAVFGGASVPIVKMVDRDTRLSIDISFNTVQGVRAAAYISKVKDEFPLIEPLVLLLKQFLHYRNLNQTYTGGLSSYGLVLLLVNFFQLYALNMRRRTIYDRGVNLGHLLLRFLELYSLEFNYEEMGISPGQACYIPKAASGSRYGVKRAQPGNLALEDPLLTANDVGRSTYNFLSIANAFGQALQILMVAVTLRERKGRNQLSTSTYKGSLLHLIMPFTSKELAYRNWLMSGVVCYSQQLTSASYDLNLLHNTLVSPSVDLSTYAWLRKAPPGGYERRDSRPLKIVNPADDVKNQVLEQLRQKILEEDESMKKSMETTTKAPAVEPIRSGPPLPTSTASVNTSATVSTAASVSEREDTDSPGLSSSIGAPSSEDDEDQKSSLINPIQFKKPFSEVVASGKECSKRTQTNFDDHQYQNGNGYQQRGYIDYAAAASNTFYSHKHRPSQQYVNRHQQHHRNHSQGSDASDGYQRRDRWNNGNSQRGRRPRGSSNSSHHSRHSSDSRSRNPRGNNNYSYNRIPTHAENREDTTLTSTSTQNDDRDTTITGCSEPVAPRKYADAVKKKSSVVADVVNGNVKVSQGTSPPPNPTRERAWNEIAANLAKSSPVSAVIHKEVECGFDTKSSNSSGMNPIEIGQQLMVRQAI